MLTQEMVVSVLNARCGNHASIITSAVHGFTEEIRLKSRRISDSRTGKWRELAQKLQNVVTGSTAEIFDGFSIGSNDLTQLVLGVDRDSEIVAPILTNGIRP